MEKENDYLEAVNELKKQYDTCKSEWEEEKNKLLQRIQYLENKVQQIVKLIGANGSMSGVSVVT
jgi:vacuolar-type H+-ATPase catalytic subunit A/Vma1|tara:strand:- start:933 stop:1124 length:192 start_codon:yes stop_codon:yes gene_type:complete